MFENNHMDEDRLMLKSILDSGQEEVPAHVWKGVAGSLDRIAARKRRNFFLGGGFAAVAAAAAVAVGVVLWQDDNLNIVPQASGDMIAVAEGSTAAGDEAPAEKQYIAKAIMPERQSADIVATKPADATAADAADIAPDATMALEASESTLQGTAQDRQPAGTPVTEESARTVPAPQASTGETGETDGWIEDEKEVKDRRIRTSLVLSGVAGTNSPQAKNSTGPLRSPGILRVPTKTTVEQVGRQITYGIPVSAGIGVRLHFTRRWSLGMGINYTLLTSKFNGKYTKVENGTPSVPISEYVRNTQHYIGIPINAYYNIISRDFINFYAYAGGTVEKCVTNHYQIQSTPVINHKESVKGVQLSVDAGIGVEFMLGNHVGLYLDPSLRYYFHCGQPASIRSAQPLTLGFELGLRFNL